MNEEQKALDEAIGLYVLAKVREQEKTAAIISKLVDANEGEARIIAEYAAMTRHGCKFSDLHVRKDGVEKRFEADWLYRLFRLTPQELLLSIIEATREPKDPGGSRLGS